MKLITLYDLTRARLIKTKLESFGVPCYIGNENFSGLYGGIFSVDVYVQKEAYNDAVSLLEEEEDHEEIVHCPNCNSTQINEVKVTRSSEKEFMHPPEEYADETIHEYVRYECEICGEVWKDEY